MPDKPFDIKQGRQASPTSRPIIVANQNVQDPMVVAAKKAKNLKKPAPAASQSLRPVSVEKPQEPVTTLSNQVKTNRRSLRLLLFALGLFLFILVLINFGLDAGLLKISIPLLPITNIF